MTAEQRQYLERSTRLQASSLHWYEHRAGRITASNTHAVMRTNMDSPAPSLVKKLCSDAVQRLDHVPAIKFGRDHEELVHKKYAAGEFVTQHAGEVSVEMSGLQVSAAHPHLAASPDGLVNCSCCEPGLLEVKCLYKFRDSTMKEMIAKTDIVEHGNVNKDHQYYTQVMQQMLVTGRQYCDLVLWIPAGAVVVRVKFQEETALKIISHTLEFWEKHVVPELVTRRLELQIREPDHHEPDKQHCHCGRPDRNPMVGCDNVACPHGWFHWACVGLTKEPRTKEWFCPPCKKVVKPKPTKRRRRWGDAEFAKGTHVDGVSNCICCDYIYCISWSCE